MNLRVRFENIFDLGLDNGEKELDSLHVQRSPFPWMAMQPFKSRHPVSLPRLMDAEHYLNRGGVICEVF